MSTVRWLERIEGVVDEFRPWEGPHGGVTAGDPLGWPDYGRTLETASATSDTVEAVVTGIATAGPRAPVAVIASAFEFIGGSMGLAAGERIVRAYDRARTERLPVLVLACSGGARLQEGMAALIQLARVADAARRHADAGLLQIAYLDSPTTGGVYASFASLADVIWAAPGAVIGFAGPRVVELTTGARLPPGAHSAESAAASGLVDAILDPPGVRAALASLLEAPHRERAAPVAAPALVPTATLERADAWSQVLAARAPDRPSGRAWLAHLVSHRVELRGDRAGAIDPVVVAGLGRSPAGTPIVFVALDRTAGDGRPRPAGFRTARRALALAARLARPVVTLVDTPGADPGDASERNGVSGEIARTLAAVIGHRAPTVSIVVGEGGSGGALAFAATDRCYLLEGAVFEVISPEGAAAILERDAGRAPEIARLLGLTAADLSDLGVIDGVLDGTDPHHVAAAVEHALRTAAPGDGRARLDAATDRWLHPEA